MSNHQSRSGNRRSGEPNIPSLIILRFFSHWSSHFTIRSSLVFPSFPIPSGNMAMGNSPCSSMTFPAKHVPHLRLIPRPHRQRPHLGSNATFENNRLGSSPTFGVPSPPPFVHGLVLRKFEKHNFYPENP